MLRFVNQKITKFVNIFKFLNETTNNILIEINFQFFDVQIIQINQHLG